MIAAAAARIHLGFLSMASNAVEPASMDVHHQDIQGGYSCNLEKRLVVVD